MRSAVWQKRFTGLAEALHGCEDLVGRLGPPVWLWVLVVAFDESADVALQFAGGGMNAAPQLLAGEFRKPTLDLVDPRCRGWREVDVVVRPAGEPCSNQRCLVGRVIVHDDVYVEVGRHLSVNLLEEVEKLGGAMPLVAFADDKSRGDIERCEERSGAMTDVAVGAALGIPGIIGRTGCSRSSA